MDGPPQNTITEWAILIRINYYPRDHHLQGAVHDVKQVRDRLCKQPRTVDIVILTATTPSDGSTGLPTESEELWPMYDRVVTELGRVVSQAKKGDRVYIYYSGHGTCRTKPSKHESSNDENGTSGFALVLFAPHAGRNFYGRDLAKAIELMVAKKVTVTVVLDCCFSGSVFRGPQTGSDVWSADYHPEFDRNDAQDIWSPLMSDTDGGSRNATLSRRDWLLDPNGYTVLAACDPQQTARELTTEDGVHRGGFSYLLNEAIEGCGQKGVLPTHQTIYDHLLYLFRARQRRTDPDTIQR
ncbi:peptidase C14, caspase domain-containing protein [Lasiosphaeris hirsuta]|uniref:Peptidase C14, caspase domain-containing protein n=1 Tax=Lasiosphaeris hirsuta TaxID=260670 RepID=A0AA40E9V1_9PEZI|nr:peptidase C14, caspase domain-containing protein [Lasiosphaeris hirsuta]